MAIIKFKYFGKSSVKGTPMPFQGQGYTDLIKSIWSKINCVRVRTKYVHK